MIFRPHVLVVDDHGLNVQWLQRGLRGSGGSLVWKSTPERAVAYILDEAKNPDGARPRFVLIDYAFADDQTLDAATTGLAVAAAAHTHLPDTQIVAYSGQDRRHGRTLFTAALWHWFGCRKILDKSSTQSTVENFLAGANPTPEAVREQLRASAHLIDLFFYQPANRLLLSTLHITRGDSRNIAKIGPRMTQKSLSRRIGELSQVAAAFDHAFQLTPLLQQAPADAGRPRRVSSLVGFAAANMSFFTDPALAQVLDQVRPWDRVSRTDAEMACSFLGFSFPDS